MRVGKDYFKIGSSFLSIEKDFALITNEMLKNQDLLKLLYYTQPDCLKADDLTSEQILSMVNTKIKIVPKLDITQDCPNQIIIVFSNFIPNINNPQFRDCSVTFNVLCHPDHWNLGNFQLRPYKIVGQLDAMFNNKKLTGIGTLIFESCDNLVLNEQLMGLTATYQAIHGVEDVLPVNE